MSLTAHLLLGKPIIFPKGFTRSHRMEREKGSDMKACHVAGLARNERTRAENVERIYQSIANGAETPMQIVDGSGVKLSTVRKGLDDLIFNRRIYRAKDGNTFHHFVSEQ
jgi:hypothetical protein